MPGQSQEYYNLITVIKNKCCYPTGGLLAFPADLLLFSPLLVVVVAAAAATYYH